MGFGTQAQLGIDATHPVGTGYEFANCTLAKRGTPIDTSGLRGSRSHTAERYRLGSYVVVGRLDMYPSAAELRLLLPWIMGSGNENVFSLTELLPARYVVVDKVSSVYTYANCFVDQATFYAAEGEPVKLSLNVVGQTEVETAAGTFPAVTYHDGQPFLFADSTLMLLGEARSTKSWSVEIHNALLASEYYTPGQQRICATDRTVRFTCTASFDDNHVDLYSAGASQSAAVLTCSSGAEQLRFDFPALVWPPLGASIAGKQDIALELNATALRTGTSAELSVTLAALG